MWRRQRKITDPLILVRLPAAAIPCERSRGLDTKFADRVEWMRVRGIRIEIKESERPRLVKKPPLPGTVIPFSSRLGIEV
jgi:hypothetical protein